MQDYAFLQDMAVVMVVAGLVTLIFHRLKQPVILGYLLAGLIIGPYTPPFAFVSDAAVIDTLADLGVVFLMFSLGMDFNLRKLKKVGKSALMVGVFEILIMVLTGYFLGAALGWGKPDSLFLGMILALTSTMIVVKNLRDRDEIHTPHAEMISGISLFDDLVVIILMVGLQGFSRTGSLPASEMFGLLGGVSAFLVAVVVVGVLFLPPILHYIARKASDEMLLVAALGICFGISLFAVKLGFSAALGAFLAGAIIAESRDVGRVSALTQPLRDMFVAVFFVAIGMQINPEFFAAGLVPALVITAVYMVVKISACALGAFLAGREARTAMKVGTNMAQLGEFAFLLAALGEQMNFTSRFLYPLVVSVTCLNALLRPYLVDNSDHFTAWLGRRLPRPLVNQLLLFQKRRSQLQLENSSRAVRKALHKVIVQVILTLILIAAGFLLSGVLLHTLPDSIHARLSLPAELPGMVLWGVTALLLLPLYVGGLLKMRALSMMLSELTVTERRDSPGRRTRRSAVQSVYFTLQLILLLLVTVLSSAAMLPPRDTALILVLLVTAVGMWKWPSFNRWYSQGKSALITAFQEFPAPAPSIPDPLRLTDAHLRTVRVLPGPVEGKLIRELGLRTETGATIVALDRDGKSRVNPGPDIELLRGDLLLLLGTESQLDDAEKHLGSGLNP
ncbi:MAG: cation:proton antiporter [Verrucomicrobia bacterium]|nr:cation:proton antiporter [Verrucomicrobiota bacterium]MCH8526259.1 cation:proton antiporter [Kiritimatiellia bacterium]